MLAALLLVLAVLVVGSRLNDPDMWWHMRMGQIICTAHAIPVTDLFSFTTNHHPWIPHEWLAQVTIFLAWKWGGYSGLMLWLCLFTAALFIAAYALCSLYSGNAKVAFLGALIVFLFATVGLSVRPQLIGYLFLIVELILIHLGRTRSPRWFWALPPIFALWVNLHGSFFLGLIVAAALLFSSFFQFRAGGLIAIRWQPDRRRIFIVAMALSSAALFINPVGLRQVLYPLDPFLHQQASLGVVQEWLPLQLNSQRGILYLAVLAGVFLLVAIRKSEIRLDELLLLAMGTWLAGSHARMLFVFGILAAPIVTRMLADSWEGYNPARDRILPNAVMIVLAFVAAWWAFPSLANLTHQVEETSPVHAVEFIQAHHLAGPMLNTYTDGGYLIWAMPEHPVFIDGRGDVFEWTGVFQEFGAWATLQADPNALLDKYKIQFCLLSPGSPMARVLPLLPNWKAIYTDKNSVVFLRTPPATPFR
jgi:hypothetical protein